MPRYNIYQTELTTLHLIHMYNIQTKNNPEINRDYFNRYSIRAIITIKTMRPSRILSPAISAFSLMMSITNLPTINAAMIITSNIRSFLSLVFVIKNAHGLGVHGQVLLMSYPINNYIFSKHTFPYPNRQICILFYYYNMQIFNQIITVRLSMDPHMLNQNLIQSHNEELLNE